MLGNFLLLSSLAMSASDSNISVDSSQQLLQWLESPSSESPFMRGVAHGFVEGIMHTLLLEGEACAPEHVTYGQIDAVVIKWIKDHPKDWQQPSVMLVKRAFVDAWGCRKKK